MKIIVGKTKFRANHADSNPEWTVTEKRGRGTWIATISEKDVDWSGTSRAFTTEEIQGHVSMANYWKKSADSSESFFDNLKPGSIAHYNNGFDSYVRCIVTTDHQLLPIALVGKWHSMDLPRRYQNGDIELGYHAKKIKEQEPFRPHASNVWEYNVNQRTGAQPIGFSKWADPRKLEPISLELPPMTEEEQVRAAKYKKLDLIRALVRENNEPDEIFNQLRKVLETS